MKISYAITVCDELAEIQRLVTFLLKHKELQDDIVITYDSENGSFMVEEYLRSAGVVTIVRVLGTTGYTANDTLVIKTQGSNGLASTGSFGLLDQTSASAFSGQQVTFTASNGTGYSYEPYSSSGGFNASGAPGSFGFSTHNSPTLGNPTVPLHPVQNYSSSFAQPLSWF